MAVKKMKYPFTIRGPTKTAVRHRLLVEAVSYRNALERVLAKNPNKFITIKFAKPMDYMSVMKEVVKMSRKNKKVTYYVIVDPEGECSISTKEHPQHTKAAYKNGSEIALSVDVKETANLPKANRRSVKNPNDLSVEETAFIKYFGLKGNKPTLDEKAIKFAERLQKLGYLVLHSDTVELTKKGNQLAEQLNKRQKPEDPIKQARKLMLNDKKEKAMKKVAKKSAKKVATKNAKLAFKEGQKVTYQGKSFTVRKSYVYNDRPYCIIVSKDDRKQVSANSLK